MKDFLAASLSDSGSEEQIALVKLVAIRRPDPKKPVVAVFLTTPNSSAGLLVRGYRHDGRLETQVVADEAQEGVVDEHRNLTDYLTRTPSFDVAEALVKFANEVVLERRDRLSTLEMPEILRNPAILEEKLPYDFARENENERIDRQMEQECCHLVLAYGRSTGAGTVELPLKIFGENGLVTASVCFINFYRDEYSLWLNIRDEQLGIVYSLNFRSDLGGFLERFGSGESSKYLGSIIFSPERTGQFRQVVDYLKEHYPIEGPEALPSKVPLPFWA